MMQLWSRRDEAARISVDARCHIHVHTYSRYFSADSRYFPIHGSRWARRGPTTWTLACDSPALWARLSFLPSGRIGTPRRDYIHWTNILRASLVPFLFLTLPLTSFLCSERAKRDTLSPLGAVPSVPSFRAKSRAREIKDVLDVSIDGSGINKAHRWE